MNFEILHFRDSEKILEEKNLIKDVELTCGYLEESLTGAHFKRELIRLSLEEMDWRMNKDTLTILPGRRYQFKGFKKSVAIEANFSFYEFIHEGLFRLQVGYDKGLIETGILMLTAKRGEKSPLGNTADIVKEEIELLYPTISMPITVVLFNIKEDEDE